MRRIIDMSNLDNGFSVLPTGQSGVFGSRHYSDQTGLYNNDKYKKFMFSKEAIRQASKNTLLFVPE